jgi:ABC-type transporter Mla subunit MlaD
MYTQSEVIVRKGSQILGSVANVQDHAAMLLKGLHNVPRLLERVSRAQATVVSVFAPIREVLTEGEPPDIDQMELTRLND